MKKTINENTLKSIIKESLKNYLKESMDSELGMGEEAEGWTPEMDDMWDEFGNNNVHDTDGAFGVLAQGDDDDHVSRVAKSLRSTKFDTDANMGEFEDEADEFASDDNAEYLRDKMFESVVRKSVNESFNKNTNMGKTVKLTEAELKKIISESVMNVLNEIGDTPRGQYKLGRLARRKLQQGDTAGADMVDDYALDAQSKAYNWDNTFKGDFQNGRRDAGYRIGRNGLGNELKDGWNDWMDSFKDDEDIEMNEGAVGNFMRRTFNGSSVRSNANYVDRVYQNYLKKFNQIKGHLEPRQVSIVQQNLKSIQNLAARARNGEKIGEQQVGYYTKAIDRMLGRGNDQRDAYMAKRNAPSQSQSYNNSRTDSFYTDDGAPIGSNMNY